MLEVRPALLQIAPQVDLQPLIPSHLSVASQTDEARVRLGTP